MESFAGADLHKRVTQLAVLREGQPPSQFRFANDPKTVDGVLKKLPRGTKIAVEATGSLTIWVQKAWSAYRRQPRYDHSSNSMYRKHLSAGWTDFLDPSEDADFTLWVLVIQSGYPRPSGWPTMHAVIAEKRMPTEQHDQNLPFLKVIY